MERISSKIRSNTYHWYQRYFLTKTLSRLSFSQMLLNVWALDKEDYLENDLNLNWTKQSYIAPNDCNLFSLSKSDMNKGGR